LLAIILPTSLLITLKLTGIIPEPLELETTTLKAVSWSMDRPACTITSILKSMNEGIENVYADSIVSTNLSLVTLAYDDSSALSGDRNMLWLGVCGNACVAEGYIESCNLYFYEEGNSSLSLIMKNSAFFTSVNLRDAGTSSLRQDYLKAYAKFAGINFPMYVHYSNKGILWIFLDEGNVDHLLEVRLEVTYRTRTIYRRVILPVEIGVDVDVGNSFESAKATSPGVYNGSLEDCGDPDDFYAVQLDAGQTIQTQLATCSQYADFDLYLYGPDREPRMSSCTREQNATEQVTFTADLTGTWYIQVHSFIYYGMYTLKIIKSN
jgi:hypothetical protein